MSLVETPRTARPWDMAEGWARTPTGLYFPPLPGKQERYERPVAVDLFSGAGGMGLGFHQAGFHVAAAMDNDPDSAITYMLNLARPGVRVHFDTPESADRLEKALRRHYGLTKKAKPLELIAAGPGRSTMGFAGSGWISSEPAHVRGCEQFFFGDARNFTGRQILSALGLSRGEVDVVSGGPPCQGFSVAGRRNVHDPRNSLVFEFARLVVEMYPSSFVFENVPGIVSMVTPEGKSVVDELCAYFATNGMGTAASIRAALDGRPQARAVRRETKVGRSPRRGTPPDLDEGDAIDQAIAAVEQTTLFTEATP